MFVTVKNGFEQHQTKSPTLKICVLMLFFSSCFYFIVFFSNRATLISISSIMSSSSAILCLIPLFSSEYYQVVGVCAFRTLCTSFACYAFKNKTKKIFYVTVTGIWSLDRFSGFYLFWRRNIGKCI